jgi:NAD+ kinase
MRYGIVANPEKQECLKFAKKVIDMLNPVVEKTTAEYLNMDGVPLEKMDVDIIITIGGDGTILLALQRARGMILGVNMGLLGFLTEIGPEEFEEAIEKIERGEYFIDKRMKLKISLNGKRLYDCTNEAVIHTSEIAKLRSYSIYYENELLDEFRADGIIIATPTGSTSYALSAGGPILYPYMEGMVLTPIAPFKRYPRSFVLPMGRMRVELKDGKRNLLVLDGQHSVEINGNDVIEIEKSENYASFIRFKGSALKRIRERLLA